MGMFKDLRANEVQFHIGDKTFKAELDYRAMQELERGDPSQSLVGPLSIIVGHHVEFSVEGIKVNAGVSPVPSTDWIRIGYEMLKSGSPKLDLSMDEVGQIFIDQGIILFSSQLMPALVKLVVGPVDTDAGEEIPEDDEGTEGKSA